jgi:hypothetical protein
VSASHTNTSTAMTLTLTAMSKLAQLADKLPEIAPLTCRVCSRGWTTFERCSAELIKPDRPYVTPPETFVAEGRFLWKMCIDTGAVSGARTARGRLMPTAPAAFARLLQSKTFTNSADHDQVAQLYRDTADAVLGGAEELELDNLPWMAGDGSALALTLSSCRHLKKLSLCFSPKPEEDARAFFNGVAAGYSLHLLQDLFLQDSGLRDPVALALAEAIRGGAMPALEALVTAGNHFRELGITELAKAIGTGSVPCLKTLDFSESHPGSGGVQAVAAALLNGATPALTELNLETTKISEEGLRALADAIRAGSVPALRLLLLHYNRLRDGVIPILEAMATGATPRLECIGLAETRVGDDGARAIASAVSKGGMRSMKQLHLGGCGITGVGAGALALVLAEGLLPKLNEIDVSQRYSSALAPAPAPATSLPCRALSMPYCHANPRALAL